MPKLSKQAETVDRTIVIGGGMAGLATAIALSANGEKVLLLEARAYPGGKMREIVIGNDGIDSGPTVFTMKYVFEHLFALMGEQLEDHVRLHKANILARHAWDDQGVFDLYADRSESEQAIREFFDGENADGFRRFCKDAGNIFQTLKDTFIGAQRPGPIELGNRVGLLNAGRLLALKPLSTLWGVLGNYFPDPRLQQLFGRYSTYVGSSPYLAPATLMLIAHVEQEGVWLVDGGMHELASAMRKLGENHGVETRFDAEVTSLIGDESTIAGVRLASGEELLAKTTVYCGDVSNLSTNLIKNSDKTPKPVQQKNRSLSAITWSMKAKTKGIPLHRHNVFFSRNYNAEFDSIFNQKREPDEPTVYICAQDRDDSVAQSGGPGPERLLSLTNAPAIGDTRKLSRSQLQKCQERMLGTVSRCGLEIEIDHAEITQPSDFETLFPGSGGALYGRASHGWMASFARPGAKTKMKGLYLAGGSVHPGPGVPMATLSGLLAARQIIEDRAST